MITPVVGSTHNLILGLDGLGSSKLASRLALGTLDDLKFTGREAGIQVAAHLGVGDFSHAATETVADQGTLIYHGFALEVFVAGESNRLASAINRVDGLLLVLKSLVSSTNDGLGLVAEVGGELAMCRHDFAGRVNLLAVAGGVRSNLCGLGPCAPGALQIRANLLAARAGCVEVFLGVTFDLRRAAAASRDLVTELAKPVGQLRLIDGSRELLRGKKALRLDGAGLAIVAFGYIEDYGVGVELRSDVAVDRAGSIVLKLGCNEFGCRLRRVVAAYTRLCVMLKLLQSNARTFTVGNAHIVIAADKRCERYGLGSGKSRIPSGAMLHCLDGMAIRILIYVR